MLLFNLCPINIFSKTRFSLAPYAIKLDDSQPQLTQASGDPSASTIQSSTTSPLRFNVSGPISGYLSRLNYFRYAIGFAEIQMMMKEGASSTIENADTLANSPPYLQDTWWTTTY